MSLHTLRKVQVLPITMENAWEFFSSPFNLESITPPDMKFDILSEVKGVKMYPGMMIHYHVTPLLGIKMEWVTEITHVSHHDYFIDEQRSGPYSIWHHEHHFKAVEGGVEMIDILTYQIPLGLLGDLAHKLFVRKKIESIFDYRERILRKMYPAKG